MCCPIWSPKMLTFFLITMKPFTTASWTQIYISILDCHPSPSFPSLLAHSRTSKIFFLYRYCFWECHSSSTTVHHGRHVFLICLFAGWIGPGVLHDTSNFFQWAAESRQVCWGCWGFIVPYRERGRRIALSLFYMQVTGPKTLCLTLLLYGFSLFTEVSGYNKGDC